MTGDIRFEIGELAVHGVEVLRPERLGPAMESALTGLLRDRGVPTGWRAEPAGPLNIVVEHPIRAEVLAERLALAVYKGLSE
jgi:hypothetical protein